MSLIDEFDTSHRPVVTKSAARQPPVSQLGLNIVQRGSLVGQVLALYQGSIFGWVLDLDDPARSIEVVLDSDGDAKRVFAVADITLPLAVAPPAGVDGHGFRIRVRPAWFERLPARRFWSPVLGARSAAKFQVRTGDGMVLSHDLTCPAFGAELSSLGMKGFCDASDDGAVKGWASRESASDERLDIAVFVDQKFLTRVCANRYREDVHNHGHGDGECGFRAPLPKGLRDGMRRRIDVVMADSGLPLTRSPLWAEGRRLTYKPQAAQAAE